jgi:hypothetical protein
MNHKIKNLSHFILFLFSLITSYTLGLVYYDSTKGLDFATQYQNVKFFMGEKVNIFNSDGSLYFYIISNKISNQIIPINPEESRILLNNSIQFINFLIFSTGLLGLVVLFRKKGYDFEKIFLGLTVLCFFPTAYYFRLTMKPEIMAFALIPWVLINLDSYFLRRTRLNLLLSTILLSCLLTIKGSVTGMLILSLTFLYRKKIFKSIDVLLLSICTLISSLLAILVNYKITNIWIFEGRPSSDLGDPSRWQNTASFDFFWNIDLRNLYENPFKYIHSDSFISITLLDTLSDYFHFFWKHQEDTNYIAFNRVEFTNNFLIQTYLSEYISIIFTCLMYFSFLILYFKKVKNKEFLIFPFFGVAILIINSFGFPYKNFDPNTGDLFKVHYYSFLIAFSFFALLVITMSKYRFSKYLVLFLIPVFLITIGFPKNLDLDTKEAMYNKINYSEICSIYSFIGEINCK